jgi:hypothetical protein
MITPLSKFAGLASAAVGAVSLVRGAWEDVVGCAAVMVVVSLLAALWAE